MIFRRRPFAHATFWPHQPVPPPPPPPVEGANIWPADGGAGLEFEPGVSYDAGTNTVIADLIAGDKAAWRYDPEAPSHLLAPLEARTYVVRYQILELGGDQRFRIYLAYEIGPEHSTTGWKEDIFSTTASFNEVDLWFLGTTSGVIAMDGFELRTYG